MNISDIIKTANAKILTKNTKENFDIKFGFASDLMSDVLAFASHESLLITGLNNTQVIRTAEMMDIPAILFVRGKKPNSEVLDLASETSITILMTDLTMFSTCGILYQMGLKGIDIYERKPTEEI